jgi:hypothetical protein
MTVPLARDPLSVSTPRRCIIETILAPLPDIGLITGRCHFGSLLGESIRSDIRTISHPNTNPPRIHFNVGFGQGVYPMMSENYLIVRTGIFRMKNNFVISRGRLFLGNECNLVVM